MGRRLFLTAVLAAVVVACATPAPAQRVGEKLYFAVEVHQGGKRIAAPKLLGFAGRRLLAERRIPGAPTADYRLVLMPKEHGSGYEVVLQLDLPDGQVRGQLGLLHGEERRIALDASTELRLMLMRVDSPEFRALMSLSPTASAEPGAI